MEFCFPSVYTGQQTGSVALAQEWFWMVPLVMWQTSIVSELKLGKDAKLLPAHLSYRRANPQPIVM